MTLPTFRPGFRFSALDAAVLVVGAIASAYAITVEAWLGAAIAFVVLHFFPFCNVLRMARSLELVWAGVFVVLAVMAVEEGAPWPSVFAGTTALTLVLAAIQVQRPSYHGVAWRRLNPQLLEWWRATHADEQAMTHPGAALVAVHDREADHESKACLRSTALSSGSPTASGSATSR